MDNANAKMIINKSNRVRYIKVNKVSKVSKVSKVYKASRDKEVMWYLIQKKIKKMRRTVNVAVIFFDC